MRNIEHQVLFEAAPAQVFEALMDSKQHSQFTGEPAKISRRGGGPFKCYGDYIKGITLELEPGQRIVQAWRSRNWPEGVYSIVTFRLSKSAGGKTRLRFSQVGVPASDYRDKNKGWRTHYWEPLKRFLDA